VLCPWLSIYITRSKRFFRGVCQSKRFVFILTFLVTVVLHELFCIHKQSFEYFSTKIKQGLQLVTRKHDQNLEIVKVANDFITLTIFYLKLWPTTLTIFLSQTLTNFDFRF
jgi:hypothetical protein